MKLPRLFVATTTLLAGCSSPSVADGGTACPLSSACDAGAGLPEGQCVQTTDTNGNPVVRCELMV